MWYIMSSFESLLLCCASLTFFHIRECIMLMPQYMEKALAISSSKKEKCLPLILLHSSATPITADSSLMGKHRMFLVLKPVVSSIFR
uniref:Putative secreted protein n=1 Tax=Ixodes ricinus TaxID=34613 RepID=A0A6B0U9Y4_IXORI